MLSNAVQPGGRKDAGHFFSFGRRCRGEPVLLRHRPAVMIAAMRVRERVATAGASAAACRRGRARPARPRWPAPLRWPVVLLFAPVLLATAACAGGWVRDHPDVAARARSRPDSFVQAALGQWAPVRALGASYTLRVSRGIAARTLDTYITVQRPDRIDILVLAPTGMIEAYLRANEREVGLFLREEAVLYAGPATPEAFERALGIGLSAADAVAALIGYGVEAGAHPPPAAVWEERARRVRLRYGAEATAWLHPLTLRIERVHYSLPGGQVEVEIDGWRALPAGSAETGGAAADTMAGAAGSAAAPAEAARATTTVPIPEQLRLRVRPDGLELRLRMVGEAALNPDLPAEFFELQRVPGVVELPLQELSREGGLFRRHSSER